MPRSIFAGILIVLAFSLSLRAQDFEAVVVDVGNVGLTVTNVGFVGRASVRNNPTGPPSFEYPVNSGVEHLFESGLWIGAVRSDGVVTVRTAAVTSSGGYRPGATGYETAPNTIFLERSSLLESDAYNSQAVSHQDYVATFNDTAAVLPGTNIPMPDVVGRLNASVDFSSYAWNFPFAESFVVLNFDITNVGQTEWDSVFVGLYHDIVVRNVNTTIETGSAFFNKNGIGVIDSLYASYGFNAGGQEESINTYGSIVFLGAEWPDPVTGQKRYVHPNVAQDLIADGLPAARYNARWWLFNLGPSPELSRPQDDQARYRRMGRPYPDPAGFTDPQAYQDAREAWFTTLRTGGISANGNYIGLSSFGPFASLEPGQTMTVTFAAVAAQKPLEFQGLENRSVDNDQTRVGLVDNIGWAIRTYNGEDLNNNGVLDPNEDANGDGVLSRYLIPEPPTAPKVHVELAEGQATLYWDASAEASRDPVSGRLDFEGYRVYRSNPGDDLGGDVVGSASLIAQYDRPGNEAGFNNGFGAVALEEPVSFDGDPTQYRYRFEDDGLSSGWQYVYTVTAFDEGDQAVDLPSFESSRTASAVRVFPGTPPVSGGDPGVGVYPNPYRINAAWDGSTSRTRKLNFYNLPQRAEVRIYTLAGEIVAELDHDAATYNGDIRWYDDFSAENRVLPGGEHSWDILSESGLSLSTGLYLFTVQDLDTSEVQTGKFAIIK